MGRPWGKHAVEEEGVVGCCLHMLDSEKYPQTDSKFYFSFMVRLDRFIDFAGQ